MSLRRMDLRPEAVRRRVREANDKRLVSRAATVAGCLFVVAWSVGALRLGAARRSHADVVERADATMAIEQDLVATTDSVERLGQELAAWRRTSIPFDTGAMVAAVVEALPRSATLQRLELDAGSLMAVPLRPARGDRAEPTPRVIEGEIEGFAATDEEVAAVADALRGRPHLRAVRVESTRHLDVEGDPARSFRIAFEIDLASASPVPVDPEMEGEGS